MCGGSIYNENYIITAAHCVLGTSDPAKWSVKAGKHDLTITEAGEATYKVLEIQRHENYKWLTNENDIAIMKVSGRIVYSNDIQPICMPSSETEGSSYVGEIATVTGWGSTKEGGPNWTILQQTTVPVVSNEQCQQAYENKENIIDSMICAGHDNGGTDSCQGDSGGALVLKDESNQGRWTQIGIVSFGFGCAQAGYPGVYTRLSSHVKWLKENAI